MSREVILTGLRSNSSFHLGNYLGAIQPIVKIQSELAGKYQINMFVPDLHSFTTPVEHASLYKQTIDNLKVYVAAGLNLEDADTFIYRQSYISAHSELAWILSNFTYYGELSRMTQFKEKTSLKQPNNSSDMSSNNGEKSVSAGLFMYPVLMASDILLYNASWVPVGEDQRQHLELARDIAIRFNNKFSEIFTVPKDWKSQLEFIKRENGARIRSLKNPERKMSKSIEDPSGTIMLGDSPEGAVKKIMGATTDSENLIRYDWEKQPGIANLLQILALLKGLPTGQVINDWENKTNYGELKSEVAEQVRAFLTSFQSKLTTVNEIDLMSKLESDEQKIRDISNTKLHKVQQAVGLRP